MANHRKNRCSNCQQLQTQVDALQARLEALSADLLKLQEQLAAARKDSSTSSKPPSSDIVKPPALASTRPEQAETRRPTRPPQARPATIPPPEQVNRFEVHTLDACPCCGGSLHLNAHFAKVVQQVDICKPPLFIEQHTSP